MKDDRTIDQKMPWKGNMQMMDVEKQFNFAKDPF